MSVCPPERRSILMRPAGVAELVDAAGLGPAGAMAPWRFESSRPHTRVPTRPRGTVDSRLVDGMRPEDVYELTGVADPRISPDGTPRRVPGLVDRPGVERVPRGDLGRRRSTAPSEPRRFTSGEQERRLAALVARRPLARVHVEPRRREDAAAALRHPRGRRRGARADRREGGHRGRRLVARLDAARVHDARARRGVRGGGRQEARAAAADPPPLQARQRRLDDRPPQARLRRRRRRAATRGRSPTATARTASRRGRPTASRSSSARCAATAGTST